MIFSTHRSRIQAPEYHAAVSPNRTIAYLRYLSSHVSCWWILSIFPVSFNATATDQNIGSQQNAGDPSEKEGRVILLRSM
jgi:hypothetical protein